MKAEKSLIRSENANRLEIGCRFVNSEHRIVFAVISLEGIATVATGKNPKPGGKNKPPKEPQTASLQNISGDPPPESQDVVAAGVPAPSVLNHVQLCQPLSEDELRQAQRDLCLLSMRKNSYKAANGELNSCLGLTVGVVYTKIEEIKNGVDVPEKQALASLAGVSASAFTKFLQGDKGFNQVKWTKIARMTLACLLAGKFVDPETPAHRLTDSTIKEIYDFFVRKNDKGNLSFFLPERLGSSHAWSYLELASEINRLAREATLQADSQFSLTFTSGGPRFFDEPTDNTCIAIQACVAAGVAVSLLYPSTADAVVVENANFVEGARKLSLDVSQSPLGNFLTPATRYLYLEGEQSTLWILRDSTDGGEKDNLVDEGPIAYRGYGKERKAFKQWRDKVDANLSAVAAGPTTIQSESKKKPPKSG